MKCFNLISNYLNRAKLLMLDMKSQMHTSHTKYFSHLLPFDYNQHC